MKKLLLICTLTSLALMAKAEDYDYVSAQTDIKADKHNNGHQEHNRGCPSTPEPKTYLCLILGIGLIAIVAINRKNLKNN